MSATWANLSHSAVRCYLCFRHAENGHNKRDLRVSYAYFRKSGVKSDETIARAIKQLEEAGLIDIVRHGGLYKQSNVYGLSERWRQKQTTTPPIVANSYAKRSVETGGGLIDATASVVVGLKT